MRVLVSIVTLVIGGVLCWYGIKELKGSAVIIGFGFLVISMLVHL